MESPSSNKNPIYPCTSLRFVLFLDLFKNFFAYFKVTQCSSTFSSRNYIVLSFHIWIENLFRISFSMKYDIDIKSCFFFFFSVWMSKSNSTVDEKTTFPSRSAMTPFSWFQGPYQCGCFWVGVEVPWVFFKSLGWSYDFPLYSVNVGKYTVWFLNAHLGWAPLGGLSWLQTATLYI